MHILQILLCIMMILEVVSYGAPPPQKELLLSIAGEELGHLEPAGCDHDDVFRIKFEKGTEVYDSRTNKSYIAE